MKNRRKGVGVPLVWMHSLDMYSFVNSLSGDNLIVYT